MPPCPTALALAVGDSGEDVSVSPELSKKLVETFLRRGMNHSDFFSAANNVLCDLAEQGEPSRAAEGLRSLADRASEVLGKSSLTAIRVAANAAAFSGISGDARLADEMHQNILRKAGPELPPADRDRIEQNAKHWAEQAAESGN